MTVGFPKGFPTLYGKPGFFPTYLTNFPDFFPTVGLHDNKLKTIKYYK